MRLEKIRKAAKMTGYTTNNFYAMHINPAHRDKFHRIDGVLYVDLDKVEPKECWNMTFEEIGKILKIRPSTAKEYFDTGMEKLRVLCNG